MKHPLPTGWQEVKLQECLLEQPKYGMNAPAVKYDNSLPTYIRITDIDEYGNFINDNKVSVNNENYEEYILNDNDFLFARTGASVGKTYLYNKKDGILVFAGYLIKVKPNQNILNSLFLKYYTQSKRYWDFVKITSTRTGQPGINGKEYANMNIILPPLEEQKRIAEVLSLCDDIIENLTELIDKKEQYKKGVMQRVLSGEVRFKGFKDEWTFKSLEKLCNIKKGEQKNKLDLVENGKYPVLSGGMDFSGYYNSYNREANTITISEGGNSCGYVNFIKTKFWASGHCYTLHDVNIDSLFLYQCLKYNENKIMKLRLGSGLPNIQLSYIREYTLKIPTFIEEQRKIGEFLSTIDNEIDNLKKQLELRKQQKKGLMQKLLTGEVRV